jgi:hypothetical protein
MSKKANWLNLRDLGALPEYEGNPTTESNASLMKPLKLK